MDFNALETDAGNASIDQNYCLSLNVNEGLAEVYIFDISQFGFVSAEEATKAFNLRSNNLVSYAVDFSNNRVFAKIHTNRIPDGEIASVDWWNNYFSSLCSQQ